MLVHENTAVHC